MASKARKEKEEEIERPPLDELEEEEENPNGMADQNSGSGSESESESESDSSPSKYQVQPIPKPLNSAALKRHRLENSTNEQPKTKKSKSPSPITRLWSNEDEIVVLRRMDKFRIEKGLDPNSEIGAFYHSIKGKLQGDYSKEQLKSKIKRLRRRFLNAAKKSEDGSDPVFSKPHEVLCFELSKKIWGAIVEKVANGSSNEGRETSVVAKKDNAGVEKGVVMDEKEKSDEEGSFWTKFRFLSDSLDNVVKHYPSLGMREMGFVKENLSLIGMEKAKELDDKWKELFVEEMEVHYKMAGLARKQIKMVFDLMKQ